MKIIRFVKVILFERRKFLFLIEVPINVGEIHMHRSIGSMRGRGDQFSFLFFSNLKMATHVTQIQLKFAAGQFDWSEIAV